MHASYYSCEKSLTRATPPTHFKSMLNDYSIDLSSRVELDFGYVFLFVTFKILYHIFKSHCFELTLCFIQHCFWPFCKWSMSFIIIIIICRLNMVHSFVFIDSFMWDIETYSLSHPRHLTHLKVWYKYLKVTNKNTYHKSRSC